jgi:hypothetical protein
MCGMVIRDADHCLCLTHKVFALHALENILALRSGRIEFFNLRGINAKGKDRDEQIEVIYICVRLCMRIIKFMTSYLYLN